MINGDTLYTFFSQRTPIFNLQLWVIICICVVAFIIFFLFVLCICILSRRNTKLPRHKSCYPQIPVVSKEINICSGNFGQTLNDNISENGSKKPLVIRKSMESDNMSQCSSVFAEESPLGWGHWFTLRDLEHATDHFCQENVIGEGGYGVVYKGCLFNGTKIAVKRLLCNVVQAEREFRVEVEAIAHVRHKNLVRFLGYCVEGTHRMLVYEYLNNGNLDQWLHGESCKHRALNWESRMKIILGTAKAIAYLHEAVEPKVVHRDIKSSNILLDNDFNAKVSDFGLAKLMDAGESHVETRVMGTFGYVAPEYAYSGMLNEKSDVYSFGVLMLEVVTGRDPVDYKRVKEEVNLVEWFKTMVCSRRTHELMDPKLDPKPATKVFKRILLVALKCIDLDSGKRPKMSQVVKMLEKEDELFRQGGRNRSSHGTSLDIIELDNILESSIERD